MAETYRKYRNKLEESIEKYQGNIPRSVLRAFFNYLTMGALSGEGFNKYLNEPFNPNSEIFKFFLQSEGYSKREISDWIGFYEIDVESELPPWEELDMTEDEFIEAYPEQYEELKTTLEETEEPEEELFLDMYTQTQLEEMAEALNVSVEEVKRLLTLQITGEGDELSEYQRKQLELAEDRLTFDKIQAQNEFQKAEWERQKSIADFYSSKGLWNAAMASGAMGQVDQRASIWEEAKQNILSNLSPSEWVTRYKVTNTQNPYDQTRVDNPTGNTKELLGNYKRLEKFYKEELSKLKDRVEDEYDPLPHTTQVNQAMEFLDSQAQSMQESYSSMEAGELLPANDPFKRIMDMAGISYSSAVDFAQRYAANPNAEEFANLTTEQTNVLKGGATQIWSIVRSREKPQSALNIPKWMQPLTTTGQKAVIGNEQFPEAITPSAQKWYEMTPTQKSMWANYVTEAGQNPEQLYGSMTSQLPQPLRLGKTWATAQSWK